LIKKPRLGIYYAMASLQLGRMDQVELKLLQTGQILDAACKEYLPAREEEQIRWEMASIRAVVDCSAGKFTQSIPKIRALMDAAPPEDSYFYGFMNHCLAETYDSMGEFANAAEEYERGCQFALRFNLKIGYLHSGCGLARVYKYQGRLREAEQKYRGMIGYVTHENLDYGAAALARMGVVEIEVERGNIRLVDTWVQEVVDNFERVMSSALVWPHLVLLILRIARYYLACRDLERAKLYFHKALSQAHDFGYTVSFLLTDLYDVELSIWLASPGAQTMKGPFDEELPLAVSAAGNPEIRRYGQARILMAWREPAEALPILLDLESAFSRAGMGEFRIKSLVALALAYRALGKREDALLSIEQALQLAMPEGYVQVFVDEGREMAALLADFCAQQMKNKCLPQIFPSAEEYVEKLMEAIENGPQAIFSRAQFNPLTGAAGQAGLSSSMALSQRESEVYELLVAGKSAKEIASALSISVNTAKAHVKRVYRKMGTHSRKVVFP
jgi:LuxR family maltose regulon positive regulatory protein